MKMKTMLMLFAMLLLPLTAFAESECESDADCGEGYQCVFAPTEACLCADCPEGEECPPCNCPEPTDPEGMCVEIDLGFGNIVAGECATDADCPVDFLCQEVTEQCDDVAPCTCECMACDPDDEECDPEACECECPEPEPCDPVTKTMCVYSPTECDSDADCGDGFFCYAIEECYGGGSTGCACPPCACEPCPEGEECEPCECEPCECDEAPETFEECTTLASICFPEEVSCEEDGDCAEGFVCVETGGGSVSTSCVCPDCVCETCPEGEECEPCECEPCECEETEEQVFVEKSCLPAGWEEAEYMGGGDIAMGDAEGAWLADETAKNADGDTQAPVSPNPEEDGTGGDGENADGSLGTDDGGSSSCTMSGVPTQNAATWILFLILATTFIVVRRATR